MATMIPRRAKFDRERSFTVLKPLFASGRRFAPGSTFLKTLVTARTLRLLYEQRFLDMDPPQALTQRPTIPGKPNFLLMTKEQLRTWLIGKGINPHPAASKDRLKDRAERVWGKEDAPAPRPEPVEEAPAA